MSEAIDRYQALADQFGARVEAAPDDAWANQSPCVEWTARDVLNHIVQSQQHMTAQLTGAEVPTNAPDADPKELWRASYTALKEALAQPGIEDKKLETPMGPTPVDMALGRLASMDILVHTWDLARAVGGDDHLDQDAVAHAFEGIKPMGPMIRRPGIMGPEVEAPEGADVQTQFLCFLGRKP
jgi:uncharacterized protein (TIGR03086 family)